MERVSIVPTEQRAKIDQLGVPAMRDRGIDMKHAESNEVFEDFAHNRCEKPA